jgi:tryptophan synthase alpha chain
VVPSFSLLAPPVIVFPPCFDGILIVDLPYEEENEVVDFIKKSNLDFIRLIAPNSDDHRIKKIVKNASGFIYLISMLGITGTKQAVVEDNQKNVQRIKKISNLPIAIGFGIQNYDQAKQFANITADGVVIGSTIVKEISKDFPED